MSTHTYLRYLHQHAHGLISSPQSNAVFVSQGKLAAAAALEHIVLWNLKQGVQVGVLRCPSRRACLVTMLAPSPLEGSEQLASGHSDGTIRLWNLADVGKEGAPATTLSGHTAQVSALAYNRRGSLLASGSFDTDIIVWDVAGERGMYRLRGHKDAITGCHFLERSARLLSSSKDTLVKVWDLETQHAVQTCVGHRNEVWCFDVDPAESRVVTGSTDSQLRVFSVTQQGDTAPAAPASGVAAAVRPASGGETLEPADSLVRTTPGRVAGIKFSRAGSVMVAQSALKAIEVYRVRTADEIAKIRKRRKRRRLQKASAAGSQEGDEPAGDASAVGAGDGGEGSRDVARAPVVADGDSKIGDEFQLLCVVRTAQKIRSVDISQSGPGRVALLVGLHSNALEVYNVDLQDAAKSAAGTIEAERLYSLTMAGHRTGVRSVALSSDDGVLVSTANDAVKLWNVRTGQCIRTMRRADGAGAKDGHPLVAVFLPGDHHAVVGTKSGDIELLSLASGECIQHEEGAHEGAVWSIRVRPDGKGIVSGSADGTVKFWQLAVAGGQPIIEHTRTLKMSHDVLAVRYSHSSDPTKLLLAVALLDNTVKVFFDDSLKFFLSLYGHKLPVLCMDISDDNTLLVTGSADKNVKIWGLDFGDCHKSIFAHADSVMSVQFVPKTHYFFTAGKDNLVKYWDADTFEQILSLPAHHGEVWGLAVSSLGDTLISASHDRSWRVWERTQDQVFLEEEREKELEEKYEADIDKPDRAVTEADATKDAQASAMASRRTIITVKAGERLFDAIEQARSEEKAAAAAEAAAGTAASHVPNPMLLGRTPIGHVLVTLEQIKSNDLEEALLVLPFDIAVSLLGFITRNLA
eukprot:g2078.t1